jgi:hypothetical protein
MDFLMAAKGGKLHGFLRVSFASIRQLLAATIFGRTRAWMRQPASVSASEQHLELSEEL